MAKLVRLKKDELEKAGVPFSPSTLYHWHSRGRYPGLFVKIGRSVFLDLRKWQELVGRSRSKPRIRRKKNAR